jgi:hypothetical protein
VRHLCHALAVQAVAAPVTAVEFRVDLLQKLDALNKNLADLGATRLFRMEAARAFDVPQLQAAVDLTAEELLRVSRLIHEAE